ncbi:MAG: endolytic transglycosylase MltG [Candidatus Saccharibacteria bacterium]
MTPIPTGFNGEYRIEQPRRGALKIIGLILALIAVTLIVAAVYFFTKINKPGANESSPVQFTVAKGERTREIAYHLRDQQLIHNPNIFVLYTKYSKASGSIQAGSYVLDRQMSIAEIVDVLTAGKVVRSDRRVTVIEGWSNRQIESELVTKRQLFSASDFDAALKDRSYSFKYSEEAAAHDYEGFLFPDTYQIAKDAKASDLIGKMLAAFQDKFSPEMVDEMDRSGLTMTKTVTLASIVEKEVGRNKDILTAGDESALQDERRKVASVFLNRLAIGMPLESDATVNYVTGKADRSVTIADTKIKSPYNTYYAKGLPPGPIGNPGLGSIRAVLEPAQTDYLFFLSKPDGEAVFARTLAEHNANRAKYLK